MEFITESLQADWQTFLSFSPRLIYAAIVLIIFFLVARALSNLVARIMHRSERLQAQERYVRRLVMWAIRILGVLFALSVMGFKGLAASMLATGGVVAIVLGFAFREIGENLLAGIFLNFSRPFEVGDLIKSGGLTGTVRAIDVRSVHIRTADACDVFVPSAQIFREELYNYTRDGLRRPNFCIGVAYHDEPEAVVSLLQNTIRQVEDVLPEPQAFVSIQQFADGWIIYEVFFWVDISTSRRGLVDITNDVMIQCWRVLREAGMTFSTDVTSALEIRSAPPLTFQKLGSEE
ncbi:MAG: mechanosensitive ion channel domain-containing protein [Lysobacterales bacterium]